MVKITEQAGAVLLESLQAGGAGPNECLRLQKREGRFALDVDTPAEQDYELKYEEKTVLVVDPEVGEVVGDALIDVQEGPAGLQLTIRRQG